MQGWDNKDVSFDMDKGKKHQGRVDQSVLVLVFE